MKSVTVSPTQDRPSFRNCSKGGRNECLRRIGGAKPCICWRKPTVSRGVWGHAPPGNFLLFRFSEMASGAFSGTFFWMEKIGCQ